MNVQIHNKLEQLKAEILVCKHKSSDEWCDQCLHRLRIVNELEELINAVVNNRTAND